jgi:hypothetical protein
MIIKTVLMVNITSMNKLPIMERWVQRDHCAETIGSLEPVLARYQSYRVVAPPPEMHKLVESYGYYNWRVTELWMDPMNMAGGPGGGHVVSMIWPKNYNAIVGQPEGDPMARGAFVGKPQGPHPPASGGFPSSPTQIFVPLKGTYDEKPILRWVSIIKYPQGVPVEEGEKWFLDVHSKEVMQQPGLNCYFSYKAMSPPGRPPEFIRLNEQWYEDFDSWKKAVIDAPPKYTKPSWAKYDKYPFLEPYIDFCSTFLLEKPTNNFLRDYNGYVLGF